jgi:hypothetical protein
MSKHFLPAADRQSAAAAAVSAGTIGALEGIALGIPEGGPADEQIAQHVSGQLLFIQPGLLIHSFLPQMAQFVLVS